MNRNYLTYGLVVLLIGLLIYGSWEFIKVEDVNSRKIENRMEEKMGNKSENQKGREKSEKVKAYKDKTVKLKDYKENIKDEEELNKEVINREKAVKKDGKYEIVETFNTRDLSEIPTNMKYERYTIDFSYVVTLGEVVNIRKEPRLESPILRKSKRNEKINLSKSVKGQYIEKFDSDIWYKVYWEDKGEVMYGYMLNKLSQARSFKVDGIEELLNELKTEIDGNRTAYISNYKNRSGVAPLYKGKSVDDYGIRRYQAAPAYMGSNYKSVVRYIPDGTLLSVLEEKDNFFKVKGLSFEGQYWIPQKYVSIKNSIEELKKVVVVDRKNQNETVFEYSDNKWRLVSYGLSTTGRKGRYRRETPLGYYMAIEKKPSFLYYKDGTKKIAGYAPYAMRFTGGIYIHGIPTNFRYVEGKRINPGSSETSSTIGTVPLSHGCVRNNTSHAKFLYEWIDIGKSAILVIDELPYRKLSSSFKNRNTKAKTSIRKW
ncbi:L,D-transpeptidase family protein [Wukongibacter sp. M2B1]|uniref:L,D-transpeptidase family protein n=1 Tax=Wukongibacter sp. M2B1 TaxID=3088895 RepID=UPI003D7A7DE5